MKCNIQAMKENTFFVKKWRYLLLSLLYTISNWFSKSKLLVLLINIRMHTWCSYAYMTFLFIKNLANQTGEDQQQSTVLLRASHREINLSSRRRGGPISKHISSLRTHKYWSWVSAGPRIKNYCAGEGQQQIDVLLCYKNLENDIIIKTQRLQT
jgi:hypothetical protein